MMSLCIFDFISLWWFWLSCQRHWRSPIIGELLPSRCESANRETIPQDLWPPVWSDLSGYDIKLWLEIHPKECPGIVVGHFEQQEHAAYAVLLIPKSGHTASYKIIVLSETSDEYAVRLLDHAEGNTYSDSGLVISKEPPGTHSEFDNAKSVRLKLDGLNVEWLEKGSVLYYWSHGRYRSVQTGDLTTITIEIRPLHVSTAGH